MGAAFASFRGVPGLRSLALATAAALLLTTTTAVAQTPLGRVSDGLRTGPPSTTALSFDPTPATTSSRPQSVEMAAWKRWTLITLETMGVIGVGAVWYWVNVDFQKQDWELRWDWDSWRDKLFSTKYWRFDTNEFYTNAVRHPFAGVLNYQTGRANGLGMLGSSILNFFAATAWEYIVEFKEYPSINDIIVNTSSGVAIGEPLFQIGRFGRGHANGYAERTLASSVDPFDWLHGWVAGARHPGPDSAWYRLGFSAGVGSTRIDDESRNEGELALDLDLVTQPHYGRAGSYSGWTQPGAWNRVTADVHLDDPAGEAGLAPGTYVRAQTSFFGHYSQDVHQDAEGLHGSSLFVGAATAYLYDRRRLNGEWDRLGVAHLGGPRLELVHYGGGMALSWELAGYVDFAMIHAYAFDEPFVTNADPLTSTLLAQGYYYGGGGTITNRLRLDAYHASIELEVRVHQYWSIDGYDRHASPDNIHDVLDQRLYGELQLEVRPGASPFAVGASVEGALRRGVWRSHDRRGYELGATTRLIWRF